MQIDGKRIADDIYSTLERTLRERKMRPVLTVFACAPNFETQKYLALKEKKAAQIGVETRIQDVPPDISTAEFLKRIREAVPVSDGIIVQLPLPETLDRDTILRAIPPSHDVDALNPNTTALYSPVVGAIASILSTHEVRPFEKYVTIIGSGRLVGLPAYRWFTEHGAYVSMVTRDTADIAAHTKNADIIVCGAGVPGLLTPEMVKEGVIILDAGTSEDGGELRGDADPRCAEKASLFTPVPGGIGPLTIAQLLSNVVDCARRNEGVL